MTFSDPIFQGPEPGSSSELPLRSFGFWAGRADRSKVGSYMHPHDLAFANDVWPGRSSPFFQKLQPRPRAF